MGRKHGWKKTNGQWNPTEATIEAECERIQSTWNRKQEYHRRTGASWDEHPPYEIPVVENPEE